MSTEYEVQFLARNSFPIPMRGNERVSRAAEYGYLAARKSLADMGC